MIRIRLVLPACVAPSSTVTAPGCGAMLMSCSQVSAPTFLLMPSSVSCMMGCPSFLIHKRFGLGGGRRAVHPGTDAGALGRGVVQPQLAAPPQHVVTGQRPFGVAQEIQFGFIEARRH